MTATIVCFLLLLVCSIPVYTLTGESTISFLFGNIAQLTGLIFAIRSYSNLASCFSRTDPLRRAMNQMAFGAMIWLLGQGLEMYCELVLNLIAYGTIADALWIVGYFPMVPALYLILKQTRKTPARSNRNVLLLSGVAYLILFLLLIWPQLIEPDQQLPETILDFLYPTLDFLLIVQCVLILWNSEGGSALFQFGALSAIAMVVTLVGDGIIGLVKDFHSVTYITIDIYYFSCYFLMALAADLARLRTTVKT